MTEFFSRNDYIKFYLRFFVNKTRIITDIYDGRLQIIIIELMWILRDILGLNIYSSSLIYKDFFKTKSGNFLIHKDLQTAITISPTFEIDDREEIISLIEKYVEEKQRILFIDVGASIGVYSIYIGRKFRSYKFIDIVAFEPDANNFYEESNSLFKKNIEINNLKNIKVYKIGLGSKDTKRPNKFGILTKKLDNVLDKNLPKKYDVVFIKIDIEGFEEDALRGAELFIKNSKILYLLLEDAVDKNIFKYLENNFKFYKKISPYNSFWTK